MKRSLTLFFLLFSSLIYAQTEKHWLKPTDLYNIPAVSAPQVSSDGKWVAYSLSVVDTAKDKRVSHLWMQSWDGTQSIELTHGPESTSSPKWSPDGKYLSFISSRGEAKDDAQVWLMNREGGEGKLLTNIKGGIDGYEWSPDGKKMLLLIQDPENSGKPKPKTARPIVIDRYQFKQDIDGYLQHLHTHLYLFDVGTKKLDTLTNGNTDEEQPVWSPDGETIAYVSNHTDDPDRNENSDIFTIAAKPNSQPIQLTNWKGHDTHPQWSPDGKQIAYLRSTADGRFLMYDEDMLAVMNTDGSNKKLLTEKLDRPVTDMRWAFDGKSLVFTVVDDRKKYLDKYDLTSGQITNLVTGQFSIGSFEPNSSGGWVMQLSTPNLPAELFVIESDKLRRLTFQQEEWLSHVKLAHVRGFQSKSSDGTLVSGIVFTQDSLVSQKLPFILYIHGGPVGQDDYAFDATRQTLACAGFAVADMNYRGSSGRGLAYTKSIYADWGNKELKDLLGGVDELVKQGIADPNRLGVAGWSYGGMLTDYIIASDTRFKAASSGAGSGLQFTMYGSDEYVNQYVNELGQPWQNPKKWMQVSYPFFRANRIKTPTLFMSGLKDFNVPTAGSEQMYEALRSQDIPTQLILYPNQYHGFTTPSYQVDRLQRYIDWFGKYLKD
jgi:dipeptidyl aminopeptidase/acylaminoacyl peptidase